MRTAMTSVHRLPRYVRGGNGLALAMADDEGVRTTLILDRFALM
jgi:hypothetical protein